jgi:hypothetical protein
MQPLFANALSKAGRKPQQTGGPTACDASPAGTLDHAARHDLLGAVGGSCRAPGANGFRAARDPADRRGRTGGAGPVPASRMIVLDPLPFRTASVAVRAEGKRLHGRFSTEADLHRALDEAETALVTAVLHRA